MTFEPFKDLAPKFFTKPLPPITLTYDGNRATMSFQWPGREPYTLHATTPEGVGLIEGINLVKRLVHIGLQTMRLLDEGTYDESVAFWAKLKAEREAAEGK